MSGKAVKFFIDGVPLEMLGKGVDLSTLPVNMADRVEIYKGVVPVHLSTDAMGGAVNIISPSASKTIWMPGSVSDLLIHSVLI
jgi:outer membrane cobalamin receptor